MCNFRGESGQPQRMVHRVAEMEALVETPILAADCTLYWAIYRTLGIGPVGSGNGSLLDSLRPRGRVRLICRRRCPLVALPNRSGVDPAVGDAATQPFGLLHHHGRRLTCTRARRVAGTQDVVPDLVVDQVAPIGLEIGRPRISGAEPSVAVDRTHPLRAHEKRPFVCSGRHS